MADLFLKPAYLAKQARIPSTNRCIRKNNQSMNLNSKRYIGAALIFLSLLPLSHGSQLLGAQLTYIQESSVREAIVVDHASKAGPRAQGSNVELIPVVEFVDDDGTRRTAKTNVASYPAPNAIGEQVSVRVHHTRPDDIRLVSFAGLWLESAFYLVPGLLTLALGIFVMLRKSK